jgi:negative regulator of sigma E activity
MNVYKDPNRLEYELKGALRRQQLPDGFADRLLGRIAMQEARQRTAFHVSRLRVLAQPLVRWAAAAAVCVAVAVGGVYYRQIKRERVEGEAAKQRLILALRIAGSKLQLAKSKVQHLQADQTENQQERE